MLRRRVAAALLLASPWSSPALLVSAMEFRESRGGLFRTTKGRVTAMSKSITRQELGAKVLAAIREHPKCGSVQEVAITPTETLGVAGTTWHVNIVDSGDADVELVVTVARRIQENLGSSFEVID